MRQDGTGQDRQAAVTTNKRYQEFHFLALPHTHTDIHTRLHEVAEEKEAKKTQTKTKSITDAFG